MKKSISLILVIILLVSCIPAFADETWTISNSGALKVNSGVKLSGEVVIPETVDGITVTSLDSFAFNNQNDVISIVMPDTIQSMGGSAINFLNGLTSVKLSENLTVIDDMNFCAMKGITNLTIPASVCFIGDSFNSLSNLQTLTFEGVCPMFALDKPVTGLNRSCVIYVPDDQVDAYKAALTNGYGTEEQIQPSGKNAVIYDNPATEADFTFDAATGTITGYTGTTARLQIPATIGGTPVKAIGEKAFYRNSALCYVIIPEGVETIANYAFGQCDNVLVVDFPATLKKIGDGAFEGCYLSNVSWKEGLEEIGANAFARYGVQTLALPSTVKTIGEAAFKNGSIRKLYIGNQIESIGPEAFANNFLDRVELLTDRMIQIDETAFAGNTNETYIYLRWNVPYDVYKEYEHLFLNIYEGSTYLYTQAPIKDPALGLEYPADGTDSYNQDVWVSYNGTQPNLMTWYSWNRIPITTLGDGLFKGNQTIRSWYCSHEFTMHHIGNEAFADSSVEFVDLYHEIYTIGDAAFRNCVNIKEITLPETLTSIAANAFEGCTGLEKITILCDPSVLPKGMLDTCTALIEISAGENATEEQNAALQKALYSKEIIITQQPTDAVVAEGETANIEVQLADSEGLTFKWYVRNMKDRDFVLDETVTGNIYSVVADDSSNGRMVYCEISDDYGTVVETDVAMITIATPLAINGQPVDVELPEGEMTNITVEATGDDLSYQWYVMLVHESEYHPADGFTTNVYSVAVDENSDWSKVYCEITDAYGNTVKSNEVLIAMAEPEVVIPAGEVDAAMVGHWITVSANVEGMVLTQEQLEGFGMSMWIDLKADGTADMFMEGEEMGGINWGVADGMLILTLGGDAMLIDILEDDTLSMEGIIFALDNAADPVETPVDAPVAPAEGGTAGVWNAFRAEADGMMMDKAALESYGLLIKLTLNEDGTGSLEMEGEAGEISWSESDGAVEIAVDGDSMTMTINADGTLAGDFGGVIIVFAKEGSEPPVETPSNTSAAAVSGTAEDFIGAWNCTLMNVEGVLLNPADIGINMVLVINEDGTCSLIDDEGPAEAPWAMTADGGIEIEGMILVLNTEGKLVMSEEGAEMYFERGEAPVETPVDAPVASGAGVAGTWVNENGVLVLNEDGTGEYTSNMTGGVTTKTWEATDTGCTFSDMWWNGSIGVLEDENTLNIDDGWNVFKREGWTEGSAAADILGEWTDGYGQNLLFTEDGKCMVNGEIEWNWEEANGVIAMTWGNYMGETVTVDAEGALHIGESRTYYRPNAEIPVNAPTGVAGTVEDFVGTWNASTMEMEGTTLNAADMGMIMDLTINADGTIIIFDGESEEEGLWTLVDGKVDIMGEMQLSLTEDGKLCMAEESAALYFVRGEAYEPVSGEVVPVFAAAEDFAGVWSGLSMEVEGQVYALSDFDMTIEISMGADGLITLYDGESTQSGEWTLVDGTADIDGMILYLMSDGTVIGEDEEGTKILFTYLGGPAKEPVETPVETPVDLSASPVIGVWNDGESTVLTINADGTCVATDLYGDNNMEWNIVDGVPMITTGWWSEAPLVLNGDGTLYVSDGFVVDRIFMPGEGTAAPTEPENNIAVVAGTAEDFVGFWNASVMEMEGMTIDVAEMGMVMDLTINADGTITVFDGESAEEGIWTLTDGKVDIMGEMQLALTEDGRLCMEEDGAAMYFVRGDGAEVPVVPLVGEAEDFVGLWVGYSTEVEGQSCLLSDLGVTIEIKLDADGVITLYDGEAMETGAWTLLEDGTADIDGMILTLMSDGTVIGEDPDGMKIVFNGFVGTWKACYMSMGDLRALNLSSTLILNADGTGSIDFPTPEEGNWYREERVVRFGENGMPMEILTGGFLKFGSDLGGYLVFSRDEEAVWDPSMAIPVLAPVATPAATQAPANGEEDGLQARMNRKYVAKTYTTTYGDTRDASEVGEYAIIFRENGTCDFTVSGITLPNLSWGLQKVAIGLTEVEAFVINYYGTAFNAVITDEGFDMDYYGSMILHFVPEK